MIDENSTLTDVCFEVSGALDRYSITGVLTGGSAATVYAPEVYTSYDADFVLTSYPERKQLERALAEIGYVTSTSAGMYGHPRTTYTLDFLSAPLAVGGDYIHETATLERGALRLRILTPTDCVRDRLAAFYHWGDYTSLRAAVGVARAHRYQIDFERLKEWTERKSGPPPSDYGSKYAEFLKRVA
ncbi:MAG TPA: hypothetical protein VGI19_13155 [Candidatus Cybelea sp.]|jgi:hypothetical protein